MGWRRFVGAGGAVAEIFGRVDQPSCAALSAFLDDAIKDARALGVPLKLDLSGVRSISSHGLRVLGAARQEATAERVPITIIAANPRIREILRISQFDQLFPVEDGRLDGEEKKVVPPG